MFAQTLHGLVEREPLWLGTVPERERDMAELVESGLGDLLVAGGDSCEADAGVGHVGVGEPGEDIDR